MAVVAVAEVAGGGDPRRAGEFPLETCAGVGFAPVAADFLGKAPLVDFGGAVIDPEGADFATWFLQEAKSGYCVHFATTGTVLLRALGIPARYAEGYIVIQKDYEKQPDKSWLRNWDSALPTLPAEQGVSCWVHTNTS